MLYTNQTSSQPARACLFCGAIFYKPKTCSLKSWESDYKYCSRSCGKKGKPSKKKGKPLGYPIWNKGKKGLQKAWNKGLKYDLNERHSLWKGANASLTAKHSWVIRRLGKPNKCEHCGITTKRMYHWANKSGKYKRELSDWIRLCVPCHKRYDLSKKLSTTD